eukprot:1143765-Pelagomonas_calceolata.AAC.5
MIPWGPRRMCLCVTSMHQHQQDFFCISRGGWCEPCSVWTCSLYPNPACISAGLPLVLVSFLAQMVSSVLRRSPARSIPQPQQQQQQQPQPQQQPQQREQSQQNNNGSESGGNSRGDVGTAGGGAEQTMLSVGMQQGEGNTQPGSGGAEAKMDECMKVRQGIEEDTKVSAQCANGGCVTHMDEERGGCLESSGQNPFAVDNREWAPSLESGLPSVEKMYAG